MKKSVWLEYDAFETLEIGIDCPNDSFGPSFLIFGNHNYEQYRNFCIIISGNSNNFGIRCNPIFVNTEFINVIQGTHEGDKKLKIKNLTGSQFDTKIISLCKYDTNVLKLKIIK